MDKALWSFIFSYLHNKLLHNWQGPFSDNSTIQWDHKSMVVCTLNLDFEMPLDDDVHSPVFPK